MPNFAEDARLNDAIGTNRCIVLDLQTLEGLFSLLRRPTEKVSMHGDVSASAISHPSHIRRHANKWRKCLIKFQCCFVSIHRIVMVTLGF